jgi:hypothetical protein
MRMKRRARNGLAGDVFTKPTAGPEWRGKTGGGRPDWTSRPGGRRRTMMKPAVLRNGHRQHGPKREDGRFRKIAASPGRITRLGFNAAVLSSNARPLPCPRPDLLCLTAAARSPGACPTAFGRG